MKKSVQICFNDLTFSLNVGGWHNNLYADPFEASQTVHTESMLLRDGVTVGEYKQQAKAEYKSLVNSSDFSQKQYLSQKFKEEYGIGWDEGMQQLKGMINKDCLHLLMPAYRGKIGESEQLRIATAASNGHVGAMFWIGSALRHKNDKHCVLWLSMAHNCGHLGAAFELSKFLADQGNLIDSLHCQMIAADGGTDMAFMTLFNSDAILRMAKVTDFSSLKTMLDEHMSQYHNSCGRYFRGVLYMACGEIDKGISLLKDFMESPKSLPAQELIDDVFNNQTAIAKEHIENIFMGIKKNKDPIVAVFDACNKSSSASFADYQEFIQISKSALLKTYPETQ